jgi:hypothetical protein
MNHCNLKRRLCHGVEWQMHIKHTRFNISENLNSPREVIMHLWYLFAICQLPKIKLLYYRESPELNFPEGGYTTKFPAALMFLVAPFVDIRNHVCVCKRPSSLSASDIPVWSKIHWETATDFKESKNNHQYLLFFFLDGCTVQCGPSPP